MKFKKTLASVVALILASSAFTGCENTAGVSGSDATVDLSKKPQLKVLLNYMQTDPNGDYAAKLIEEETGYKVNYSVLPAGEEALVKLNVIISSREDFDILALTKLHFDSTVGTGAYQELNSGLDVYAPDLKKKTEEGLWSSVTIDGKVLGIPEAMSYEQYAPARRVRMDLLKKAGINEMPQTLDEFYAALQALKKIGVIPMTGFDTNFSEIYSAFGINGEQKWHVRDGKIVNIVELPETKEFITFMNKLFTEGLLDSEFAQNTQDKMNEKFFGGKTAIYRMAYWNEPIATNTIKEKQPGSEIAYLPFLKNSEGKSYGFIQRGVSRVMVVPKVSKNLEYALDFMNSKVKDDEVYKKLIVGEEGVDYKIVNGKMEPILPTFTEHMNFADQFQTGTITKNYSDLWLNVRLKKNVDVFNAFVETQDNLAKASTLNYDPTTFMPPNANLAKLAPKLTSLTDETFKQMIANAKPLTDWDKFVAEWKSSGGDEATKIINEWYSANKSFLEGKLTKK